MKIHLPPVLVLATVPGFSSPTLGRPIGINKLVMQAENLRHSTGHSWKDILEASCQSVLAKLNSCKSKVARFDQDTGSDIPISSWTRYISIHPRTIPSLYAWISSFWDGPISDSIHFYSQKGYIRVTISHQQTAGHEPHNMQPTQLFGGQPTQDWSASSQKGLRFHKSFNQNHDLNPGVQV